MPPVVFPRFDRPVKAVYPVPSEDLPHLGESHSFKTMAIWNRKGGVAKTTLTHTLGFALALKGKRVLLVDADPQCDLSYLLLKEWVKNKQSPEETEAGEENYDLFFNHQVALFVGNVLALAVELQYLTVVAANYTRVSPPFTATIACVYGP